MGGYIGPELKYAGYDKIIHYRPVPQTGFICGSIMTKWNCVMRAIFRGKALVKRRQSLQRSLKDPKVQVAAIGLAGENQVFTASIEPLQTRVRLDMGSVRSWGLNG